MAQPGRNRNNGNRNNNNNNNRNRRPSKSGQGGRSNSNRSGGGGGNSGGSNRSRSGGGGSGGTGGNRQGGNRSGFGRPQNRSGNRPQGQGSQRRNFNGQQQRRQAEPAVLTVDQDAEISGLIEIMDDGRGYLRDPQKNYASQQSNPQITRDTLKSLRLRGGEFVEGFLGKQGRNRQMLPDKPFVAQIDRIVGLDAANYAGITPFEELEVVHPIEQLKFETDGGPMTTRIVDLFAPIGKGQRALIVAPPRTGKTVLLQHMSAGIRKNYPDAKLMMLLIDERPEEVTEMRREVCADGSGWHDNNPEVVYSSNDHDAPNHARIANLMIQKAQRCVEAGQDVIILLDSLTRLGRAHNTLVGNSGRTMTGGLDIRAMEVPKRLFGAARKIDGGGSLTIIATVLVETGSRMDEFIFQEFKGTGNMELVLSRDLANLRLYPACNLAASGTRKEEMILGDENYEKISRIRRRLMNMPPVKQMETILDELAKFPNNETYLKNLA